MYMAKFRNAEVYGGYLYMFMGPVSVDFFCNSQSNIAIFESLSLIFSPVDTYSGVKLDQEISCPGLI